ncbi:MAG TPA: TIR domain-containing protein [Candidatus Saccharimonadales bacterium]|nr:TIR domain-containing protein [Candidatus Saccharimonadales bacterium]
MNGSPFNSPSATPSLANLLALLSPQSPSLYDIPKRPRIFVSYQHSTDQKYYDEFSAKFHDSYESIYDNSLERKIDSDNPEYVIQRIRDDFITSTSCTILLVGPTTYQRKYIDWEIKATLDKEHGLVGFQLPNAFNAFSDRITAPARFAQNVNSGYALWHGISWQQIMVNPPVLNALVYDATNRDKRLIVNPNEIKKQNG